MTSRPICRFPALALAIAVCGFATTLVEAATREESPRLNVLWICADDLAPYACGAWGGKIARTPNIDRLAARGMRFDRAFCNAPVCTASRQSFLTGRYPRTIGVTQLSTSLPESEITLGELLRDAGYHTAAIGKMHFNSQLKHGFDLRLDAPDHTQMLKERGAATVPAEIAVQPPWRPFRDPARIWLNSDRLPVGSLDADMSGTWYAGKAAEFLKEHGGSKNQAQPFFLRVSFTEPHSPFHFPVEFRDRHRTDEFAVPPVGADDDSQIPAIFRDLTDREKQGIAAAYHTSVEFLDRNVGRVLDALEQAGRLDDTLIVFTGDHGYLLGHHGRFEKHCCFEEAIRAPLIIALPRRTVPATTPALVEFIDIAPTILDYCRVAAPATMQGRTLRPLISGETLLHRERVFIEYSENEEGAVRDERWKFTYGTGKRERQDGYTTGLPLPGRTIRLYDLESDPAELNNLASRIDQAERVATFTNLLVEHLRRTARRPELIPQSEDVHTVIDYCLQPHDVGAEKD